MKDHLPQKGYKYKVFCRKACENKIYLKSKVIIEQMYQIPIEVYFSFDYMLNLDESWIVLTSSLRSGIQKVKNHIETNNKIKIQKPKVK